MKYVLCLVTLTMLVSSSVAHAETVELSSSKIAVTSLGPVNQVAVEFDFSSLSAERVAMMGQVTLEWELSGVPDDARSEFGLYLMTASWTPTSLSSGVSTSEDDFVDLWEFEELDFERNGGGFIRFSLGWLVKEWIAGTTSNFGVVITTPDVSLADLTSQCQDIKLIVR